MGIEIRRATPNDAAAACALLRQSIEHACVADHGGRADILRSWLGNKTPQNVTAWFASPTNHALVVERAGSADADVAAKAGQTSPARQTSLAGLALLNQAGRLALCYVHPDLLRQGVGSALLRAVEQQARVWNIGKLHLHSPASASAFFERFGYVNAGKDKACFGLECDFLWKQLDATEPPACKRFCSCSQ